MEGKRAVRYRLTFRVILMFAATAVAGCGAPRPGPAGSGSPASQMPGSRSQASPATASPAATPTRGPAACTAQDLGARFQGGGYGGGNDIGSIYIWNAGATHCRLTGAVAFAAFFASGAADRNAHPNQPQPPITVTLPAAMAWPGEGADPIQYLVAILDGPERDDPTQSNGVCSPRDELTPATLQLSIGDVALRVRNQDRAAAQVHAVYGCHGRVLLEALTAPARH